MNLRELGLNIIPCRPESKLPAIAWGEYQNKKYEGELAVNNAVICGVTSGNLVVVDLDDPTLSEYIFQNWQGVLGSTLVVQTGKKGYHVYFRVTGALPKTMRVTHPDGRHIDVQSQGAYVIAPGSIHPDTKKQYTVISSTTNIISQDLNVFFNHLISLGFKGVNEGLPSVKDLLQNGAPEGNRNNATFKYAAHLINNLNLPDDMILAEIKRWATQWKFTPKPGELEAVVKSALKRVKRPTQEIIEYVPEGELLKIRNISSKYEGKEITFGGYIAYVGELTSVTTRAEMTCPNCGNEQEVTGQGYVNPKIPKCLDCKIKMEETTKLETIDMRELYIQELQENINYSNPVGFKARVIGENVNKVGFTMRVKVTGKYKSFSMPGAGKHHNEVVILVRDIELLEEPQDTIFTKEKLEEFKTPTIIDDLKKSFAPKIKGELHDAIKESMLLAAVRGTVGINKRNRINILLIGNAARGKTELQQEFADLTGGSVVVGYNATKAGLGTGTIKLPDGTSIPKPGALVVHHRKSLCIDEQDKTHEEDLKALYECMENGEISGAKANMIGEEHLPADTTVVGGANFRYGNYDEEAKSITDNIPECLTVALITRYASVWRILDYDEYTYADIADSLLGLTTDEKPKYTKDELRIYVNSVKNLTPGISREALEELKKFFIMMTKKKTKQDMPMEPRQLIDLVNMTTARAKLLQKPEADKSDAEASITLYKKQLQSWGEGVTSIQSTLISDDQNKEQTLRGILNSCKDDEGHFGREQVIDKWEKTKWFKDRRAAYTYFDQQGYLMTKTGRYYQTPL